MREKVGCSRSLQHPRFPRGKAALGGADCPAREREGGKESRVSSLSSSSGGDRGSPRGSSGRAAPARLRRLRSTRLRRGDPAAPSEPRCSPPSLCRPDAPPCPKYLNNPQAGFQGAEPGLGAHRRAEAAPGAGCSPQEAAGGTTQRGEAGRWGANPRTCRRSATPGPQHRRIPETQTGVGREGAWSTRRMLKARLGRGSFPKPAHTSPRVAALPAARPPSWVPVSSPGPSSSSSSSSPSARPCARRPRG